ncbi:hypothetical protein [Streptomyces sp. NBC_00846]|uniref:hypothetical protein n=1 Tax=Streptomyces sp. NBC_00846 TaxID=2975849 RepID=UPI00386B01F4
MTAAGTGSAGGAPQQVALAGRGVPGPASAWQQARAIARGSAGQPLPVVPRDFAEALGRALAAPVPALTDLPPFDTSAMDGWAVAGPGPWRLRGDGVLAGGQPEPLSHGTAVPIATGARLPGGASAVPRREHGEAEAHHGMLYERCAGPGPVTAGRYIRPRGQECHAGEPLLPSGTTVAPTVLGLVRQRPDTTGWLCTADRPWNC